MQASVAFASWLEAGDAHTEWQELTWLIAQGLPLLLAIIRMVPASDDVDLLRCALFCAPSGYAQRVWPAASGDCGVPPGEVV